MHFITLSKRHLFVSYLLLSFSISWSQTKILNWSADNMSSGTWQSGSCTPNTGSSSCRPHPWFPSSTNASITITQGLTYSGGRSALAAAGDCWGGSSNVNWSNQYFSFRFTVNDAYLKLDRLSASIRRSGSGPTQITVSYRIGNSGGFTTLTTWSGFSGSGTGTVHFIDFNLATHSDLRNLTTGDQVEFRFTTNSANSGTNLYFGGTEAIYLTKENTPLPVQLTSFSGNCADNQHIISWQTASEINNDYFLIEKSFDAVYYDLVEYVKGAGNSNQALDYQISENNAFRSAYYRLTQLDFDGKTTVYAPIFITTCDNLSTDISLLNVQSNAVTIKWTSEAKERAKISIFDLTGKKLMETERFVEEGVQHFEIPFFEASSGLYILQIATQEGTQKSIKFIRN